MNRVGKQGLPTVAVVYDEGPVGPSQIARSAIGVANIVFVVPLSKHNRRMDALLRRLGPVVPLTSKSAVVLRLDDLSVRAVVTYSERHLRVCRDISVELGVLPRTPTAPDSLTDKIAQRTALAVGTRTRVGFCYAANLEELRLKATQLNWPVILKPTVGCGSKFVTRVDRPDDLEAALIATGLSANDVLVEEALGDLGGQAWPADYVSVETLCHGGEYRHLVTTQKLPLVEPFRETGHLLTPDGPPMETAILDVTSEALQLLNVGYGLTHTELKLTRNGPKVIEVNGRIGGFLTDLLEIACGLDLVKETLRSATDQVGEPTHVKPAAYFCAFTNLAPGYDCEYLGSSGHGGLKGTDGVLRASPVLRPGHRLSADSSTSELDLVVSRAASLDDVRSQLRAVVSKLTFRFRTDKGDRSLIGSDLPSAAVLHAASQRGISNCLGVAKS